MRILYERRVQVGSLPVQQTCLNHWLSSSSALTLNISGWMKTQTLAKHHTRVLSLLQKLIRISYNTNYLELTVTTLSFVLLSVECCGCWTCGLFLFLPLFCKFFCFLSVFFYYNFCCQSAPVSHTTKQGTRGVTDCHVTSCSWMDPLVCPSQCPPCPSDKHQHFHWQDGFVDSALLEVWNIIK